MQQVTKITGLSASLSSEVISKLTGFHQTLLKWNQKINLVSKATIGDAEVLHVCDGVLGSQIILKDSLSSLFYDLGSGNGVPGVIFSMIAPEKKVFCIDSDERKMSFIKFVKLDLDLRNLEVVCTRVEDYGFDSTAAFMARGFTQISKSHALIDRVAVAGTNFYHFKAEGWQEEVDPKCSTWNISELGSYTLKPKNKDEVQRFIVKGTRI